MRLLDVPVLIVDDNATNRRILEQTTRKWGMEPVVTESASAALDAIAARHPRRPFGVMLVDLHMPDVDGLDLRRAYPPQSAGGAAGDPAAHVEQPS